jgi:hypothetical protein
MGNENSKIEEIPFKINSSTMSVSFVKTKIPKLEEGDKLPEVPVNPTDKRFVSGTGTFDVEGAMGSLDANNPEHRRIQRRLSRIQSAGKAGGDIGVDRAENGTVKWRFQDAANDKGRQGGVADSERTGMGGKGFLGVSGAVYEQAYDYMVKNGFIKFSEKNLREEAAAPVKAEVAEVAGEKSPNEPVVETVVEGAAGGEKDVDVKPPARRDPPPPANPVSPAARTETPLYSAAAVQDNPITSYTDAFGVREKPEPVLVKPAQATAYGMSPAGNYAQLHNGIVDRGSDSTRGAIITGASMIPLVRGVMGAGKLLRGGYNTWKNMPQVANAASAGTSYARGVINSVSKIKPSLVKPPNGVATPAAASVTSTAVTPAAATSASTVTTAAPSAMATAQAYSTAQLAKLQQVGNYLGKQLKFFEEGGSLQGISPETNYRGTQIPMFLKGGKKILLKKPGSCGCSKK